MSCQLHELYLLIFHLPCLPAENSLNDDAFFVSNNSIMLTSLLHAAMWKTVQSTEVVTLTFSGDIIVWTFSISPYNTALSNDLGKTSDEIMVFSVAVFFTLIA